MRLRAQGLFAEDIVRFYWIQSPRRHTGSGLLGLLFLPVILLLGAVAFVLALPVAVVLYFWSRHTFKKFLRTFQGPGETATGAKHVPSVVVETLETEQEADRQLPGDEQQNGWGTR